MRDASQVLPLGYLMVAPRSPAAPSPSWINQVQQAAPPELDIDPVYAALLKVCVAEGYDKSHKSRQELTTILEAVEVHHAGPRPFVSLSAAH